MTVDPAGRQYDFPKPHCAGFGAFVMVRAANAPAPSVTSASLVANTVVRNLGQSSMLTGTVGRSNVTRQRHRQRSCQRHRFDHRRSRDIVLTANNAQGSQKVGGTVTVATVTVDASAGIGDRRFCPRDRPRKGSWKGTYA